MDRTATLDIVYQPSLVRKVLDRKVLRDTLKRVQTMLLTHKINGGERKLQMDQVCIVVHDDEGHKCGTAACIGGWAGILLVGYEGSGSLVMGKMVQLDMNMRGQDAETRDVNPLHRLFYDFGDTRRYDQPNVAATAIQRYLDGKKNPWPAGEMPDKLRYRNA